MSYNIPLDSSGDVDFAGTMSANFFVGDGSGLTNLPGGGGGVDTGADYTWSGDHIFEEGIKFNNLYSQIGGSFRLYNLGTLGGAAEEFLEIHATNDTFYIQPQIVGGGDFRDFYILGILGTSRGHLRFEGASGVGKLELKYGIYTNISVESNITKFGRSIRPVSNNAYTNGDASFRWSTGYYTYLDATFLKSNSWEGTSGNMFMQNPSGNPIYVKHNSNNSYIISSSELSPMSDNSKDSGSTTNRWANVYSYDGSFSGNLVSEAGGSFKFYNLGTEGDIDTEFIHLFAVSNSFYLQPNSTGSGVGRDFFITGDNSVGGGHLKFTNTGGIQLKYGSNTNIELTNTSVTIGRNIQPDANNSWTNGTSSLRWSTGYFNNLDATRLKSNFWDGAGSNMFIINPADTPLYLNFDDNTSYAISSSELIPWTNNSKDLGSTTKRWATVNTVDLNASGDVVMAANVDFTNLPTSDPNTAGRLYNDSGTVKISSGGGAPP